MTVVFVSVVRDFSMYERCVRGNPFCSAAEFAVVDNHERNESIPVCYNRFLESRPTDEDAWYVFCHEDFELREDISIKLATLDRGSLWGPIGAVTKTKFAFYHKWSLYGSIEECRKDGSSRHDVGRPVSQGEPVETFDCQCLIVHSGLIRKHHLRFDDRLTFDLYVEDFCIAAKERAGIVSRIVPIQACHWSVGSVLPRYYEQESYLNSKWNDCCYTGTSSWIIGGNPSPSRRMICELKRVLRKL